MVEFCGIITKCLLLMSIGEKMVIKTICSRTNKVEAAFF